MTIPMKASAGLSLLLSFIFPIFPPEASQPVFPDYETLDGQLQAEYGDKFAFVVLIGNQREVLFEKAYGHVDSLKEKKSTTETLFNIASVNKAITASGILQLAQQRKLSLDDKIGKWIAGVPKDKEAVAIHQLLTHTSGFQQNYVCDGLKDAQRALEALMKDRLGFIPGTSFGYSNENYEMLAIIIERVTSETYERFIRKNILDPLEMDHTFFWDETGKLENAAPKNQALTDSVLKKNWGYTGSGGIYSTAGDLFRFFSAVINDRLVAKDMREAIFREHYKTSSGLSIGYGWYMNETTDWNSRELWARGNESWGHNAVIRWFPKKNRHYRLHQLRGNRGQANNRKQARQRYHSRFSLEGIVKPRENIVKLTRLELGTLKPAHRG